MIRNYVLIAYRNLLRHKGFSLINITGLAVGIASCLLIAMYVQHELSYDRYHTNLNQIYRVIHAYQHGEDAATLPPPAPGDFQVWGNAPVGAALLQDFPEVVKVVQFTGRQSLLLQHGEKRFQENDLFFADSTVFEVFSWNLIAGSPKDALARPHTIVLTERMAQKYFGDDEALGQTIIVDNGDSYTVTGVMEDVPVNSHFTFDALLSMVTFRNNRPEIFDWWGYVDFYTYFTVTENFNRAEFEAKFPELVKRHKVHFPYVMGIEHLPDVYLHSQAVRQPGTTGSLMNIYIFSTIAVFILVIACINFMNLSTARAMDRAKEVGVRKVAGAYRTSLVKQFLSESVLISVLATLIGLALASVTLPMFETLSGKRISFDLLYTPKAMGMLVVVALATGLLAGSYPAMVLSGFRPSLVLKGLFRSSSHGVILRKALVVFQFSLSVMLIIGTWVVYTQLDHLRNRDLGFHDEQMVVIDFGWDGKVQRDIAGIKNAFRDLPSVVSVSAQRTVPGGFFPKAYTEIESPDGKMVGNAPDLFEIDEDFIPNFGIQMAAGRNYSTEFPSDTLQAMIINEAAAKLYGYQDPREAIGKKFSQWGRDGVVVGVVRDFNYRSLHNVVEPLALRLEPRWSSASICLRVNTNDLPATIAAADKLWQQLAPQRPFLYSFLDEDFHRQYKEDQQFGKVFSAFAGLAIFIACFGLFGLVTYSTGQRTKEIGIRKVLGASVTGIVALLSRDFIRLVVLAIVIATPVALYAMGLWLEDFAYRIEIGMSLVILPGLIVMFLALMVISWQSVRTALGNPITSLRNE
ncbi:MAG TPA: ABC transporter permease [Ohtaekwangia sp.]|nr:ABC transporter permease [Ohtaekwangia sp.]